MTHDSRDPGWFSPQTLLWAFLPAVGLRRAAQELDNPLQLVRLLFTAFAAALMFIGVVVIVLWIPGTFSADPLAPELVAGGVAAYGMLSLVVPRLLERPLDCSTDDALASGYRSRFLIRIAVADAAGLIGFVGFILTGEPWLYLLGGVFAAVGFVRLAPSTRNLARDQDALTLSGCGRSLLDALAGRSGHAP